MQVLFNMVNTPKVSVIIPIYNVEKYLRRCVDSVLNQTYKNIEIILVDDGSPDGCPTICDEYAHRDSRVIVLHKENGGLSSARNAGLDSPLTGEYVTFVDSDDWIAPDTYEYAVKLLKKTDSDVIQYDYALANDEKIYRKNPVVEKYKVFEGKNILQHYLFTTTVTGSYSACRCLYLRMLTNGIRFREGKINEDIDWKYKVLENSNRLVDTNQIKYFYYQSGNSTSGAPLKSRDFQLREAAEILCDLTSKENYGTIAFLGKVKKARTAFSLLSKIAFYGIGDSDINKKNIVKDLTVEHRDNLPILLKSPMPLSRKILALSFAINYNLTEVFIRTAKKIGVN